MGLDFFRRAVEYAKKYAPPGAQLEYSLQTNGTLLNEAWCDFFRDNNFLIGLSLDGPRAMHDAYRVDKGGGPTFDKVMRAARLMQERQVEFNILCTVHAMNASHPVELYRFFRDEVKTQFIQFIPIVERATQRRWRSPTRAGATGEKAGDRSTRRPAAWSPSARSGRSNGASSSSPSSTSGCAATWARCSCRCSTPRSPSWVGAPPAICIFGETCGNALAMEHNGDLYSCDHYVEPDFLLGNILQEHMIELVASDKQRKFGTDKRDSLPKYCRECVVRFACHGECPRNRFILTPDGEPGLNYLCAGYMAFFKHVDRPMRIMGELLRRERAPSEIMQILAAEEAKLREAFAKTGRNDPCPCGSGKKFKQCHGRTGA